MTIDRDALREYLVANLLDGSEDGRVSMPAKRLLDEVVAIVGDWFWGAEVAVVCDYCDDGVPKEHGWHVIVDDEGFDGTLRIPCPHEVGGVMFVKIKSWHVVRTFTRVPGGFITLCGRRGKGTAQDSFGDEKTCESCLRIDRLNHGQGDPK